MCERLCIQDCPTGVLGTEPWSSGRVACVLIASNLDFITGVMGSTGLQLWNWHFLLTSAITPEFLRETANLVQQGSQSKSLVTKLLLWKNEHCLSNWNGAQPKVSWGIFTSKKACSYSVWHWKVPCLITWSSVGEESWLPQLSFEPSTAHVRPHINTQNK